MSLGSVQVLAHSCKEELRLLWLFGKSLVQRVDRDGYHDRQRSSVPEENRKWLATSMLSTLVKSRGPDPGSYWPRHLYGEVTNM